jgi:DNA-directed RNA polymerase sigma subunit (sigma70/sigma32)
MSDYVYNGQSCEYTASVSDALVAKDLMTGPILSEREKFVLHDLVVMGYTLKDVGGELGLSEERVRQIKEASIIKLRLG